MGLYASKIGLLKYQEPLQINEARLYIVNHDQSIETFPTNHNETDLNGIKEDILKSGRVLDPIGNEMG